MSIRVSNLEFVEVTHSHTDQKVSFSDHGVVSLFMYSYKEEQGHKHILLATHTHRQTQAHAHTLKMEIIYQLGGVY